MTLPSIHLQNNQRHNQTQAWLKKTRKQLNQALSTAHSQRGKAEQARHKMAATSRKLRAIQHQTLHSTLQTKLATDMNTLLTHCSQLRAQRAAQRDQRLARINQLLERQVAVVVKTYAAPALQAPKPSKSKRTSPGAE